ncbi:hypothetical protein [Francisella uliginis]|uniref:Uncharacterized protein n=1 Tax=Francisella uliginis TaxID=573570 RepID=A0A1L4BRI4_9GAMM|nr:hypothetical protein [Francisella uliginis]API86445.1 hypothetical protein F7310_03365 [Francisella uliginis]
MKQLLLVTLVFITPFCYASTRGTTYNRDRYEEISFLPEQNISSICAQRKDMEDRISSVRHSYR